jgi:hypothetical protein
MLPYRFIILHTVKQDVSLFVTLRYKSKFMVPILGVASLQQLNV